MQYIGDAKSGRLIGADQYVTESAPSANLALIRM